MISQNRQQLRQFYHSAWQKSQQGEEMTSLEKLVAQVISEHPEYHAIFTKPETVEQDYSVEGGETNPYLHMSLHLSLHEQISTDRPNGIRALYQQIAAKFQTVHDAEHKMMDCLAENLWLAQQQQQAPSEQDYLESLKRLL